MQTKDADGFVSTVRTSFARVAAHEPANFHNRAKIGVSPWHSLCGPIFRSRGFTFASRFAKGKIQPAVGGIRIELRIPIPFQSRNRVFNFENRAHP